MRADEQEGVTMLAKIRTATLSGIEGSVVTVEADSHRGLPSFTIVGLADTIIRESCSRIKPAVMNSGYRFPDTRVTVNLMPAGTRKEGSHFDLPIAMGIIALGMKDANVFDVSDTAFMGEVSLDGTVNYIRGALPLAMSLRKAGIRNIVLPAGNAEEAAVLADVDIFPVSSLDQAAKHLLGVKKADIYNSRRKIVKAKECTVDFAQVAGQSAAKRAVTVGAAGDHGLLMIGGPGCGKTMIARRIPTIMPGLTYEEKLEVTRIYSVVGLLSEDEPIVEERPFRSPHHTITLASLMGGGAKPRPGELSLAHRGVLFLDEMGEFDNRTIDAMRQPVEEGCVRISRSMEEVVFPSEVMLVAAANPCKCGNLWDERKVCTCTQRQIDSYRRKLTGPFADRIDMHIRMCPVSADEIAEISCGRKTLSSAEMKKDVEKAAAAQRERYRGTPYRSNGRLDESGIARFCTADRAASALLSGAYDRFGISMRGRGKLLKVARTIADIAGADIIREEHMAEALMYRISEPEGEAGAQV